MVTGASAPPEAQSRPPRAPESVREVESKFDVPGDFAVPDLRRFTSADGRIDTDSVQLASTYYDTSDMALLRFHLTVRRREAIGNTDDVGWQLKLPGSGFRTELHWPADGEDLPPAELLEVLEPFLDGRGLAPAVRLEVKRKRHRLIAGDGHLIAEVADDRVNAVELGVPVRTRQWREAEVELGSAGSPADQRRLGRALRKGGALPSTSRSKLARAVSGAGDESVGHPRAAAGFVLSDYFATQVDALIAGHFAITADAADSVHQTRVASRRIRSLLRTFDAIYDPDRTATFAAEIAWYAGVLGQVRDLEVLRTHLVEVAAQLPPDLIIGPVAARINDRLSGQYDIARATLLEVMRSRRYAQLLAAAAEWRDNPPFVVGAGRPAATLDTAVQHASRVLRKRLKRATSKSGSDPEMHAARKAGKRARYAREVVGDERASGPIKKLQDVLGEFQDSVVAAATIRELADQADAAREATFTYGVLHARERQRAESARKKARSMYRRIQRGR